MPYMVPSENGGKADVRWMALRRGEGGAGLLMQAETGAVFQVNAYHRSRTKSSPTAFPESAGATVFVVFWVPIGNHCCAVSVGWQPSVAAAIDVVVLDGSIEKRWPLVVPTAPSRNGFVGWDGWKWDGWKDDIFSCPNV